MQGWKIGYVRVSTEIQNTDRQLDGIELDRIYEDKCSGSTKNRPALIEMLSNVREGDDVYIHDISRAARNMRDLHDIVNEITSKGASINFVKENLSFTVDKSNPCDELLLNLLTAVYEFERSIMLERQREGIAKAKAKGKYLGRKPEVNHGEILNLLSQGNSMRKVAEITGRSLSTVARIKKCDFEVAT